ncbi:MAG: hypothetical protein WCI51_04685 [Lentisphaerota bacterium]
MYQVHKDAAVRWSILSGYNKAFVPQAINIGCPLCKKTPVTFATGNQWDKRNDSLYVSPTCPACGKNVKFWMLSYGDYPNEVDAQNKCKIFMYPTPPIELQYDPAISEISPKFAEIYSQAALAESIGYNHLVGIGYRKALEFLIKDWLCKKLPDKEGEIGKKNISQCIKEYVEDANLKICASRAIWLGNDETHYIREWSDKDIEDMKTLLKLTLYWLSAHIGSEKLLEEMPAPVSKK